MVVPDDLNNFYKNMFSESRYPGDFFKRNNSIGYAFDDVLEQSANLKKLFHLF